MPQRLGELANIALARQKHQGIAPRPELSLLDITEHRNDLLAYALVAIFCIPQILHRYGIGPAADLDDRRVVEVL